MEYCPLGNTGLYVSRLCFGAMTFVEEGQKGLDWIGNEGQDNADSMVAAAFDAGINFFDTANMYAGGASERMLGKALGEKRKDAVVATKLYHPMGRGANAVGTSRLAVMREVEKSLERLGTDYIDLYQVHGWDKTTPIEETMRALDDCVRQGKVRYIGLSNFAAWQMAVANGAASQMGTERFCSAQIYYSLVGREAEVEILPALDHLGMGTMIYSPLAAGFLSGKYTGNDDAKGRRTMAAYPPIDPELGDEVVYALRDIAEAHGVSPSQVAINWVLQQKGVTSVIMGARNAEQLSDNIQAMNLKMTDEELASLTKISERPMQYPQWLPSLDRSQGAGAGLKHASKVGKK